MVNSPKNSSTMIKDYYYITKTMWSQDFNQVKEDLRKNAYSWSKKRDSTLSLKAKSECNLMIANCNEAYLYISQTEEQKDEYDNNLENAYKNHEIIYDDSEEKIYFTPSTQYIITKAKSTINSVEQAIDAYENGFLELAEKYALQTIEDNTYEPCIYEILAKVYYEQDNLPKADQILDKALEIYKDDLDLWLLSARYNTEMKNFEKAQKQINHILQAEPNNSDANAEQIYMYLFSENDDFAFKKAKEYSEQHPDDIRFKEIVITNIMSYANKICYVDGLYIKNKKDYKRYLYISKQAYKLFPNELSEYTLAEAKCAGIRIEQREYREYVIASMLFGIFSILTSLAFWLQYTLNPQDMQVSTLTVVTALTIFFVYHMITIWDINNKPTWRRLKSYYNDSGLIYEDIINGIGYLQSRLIVVLYTIFT